MVVGTLTLQCHYYQDVLRVFNRQKRRYLQSDELFVSANDFFWRSCRSVTCIYDNERSGLLDGGEGGKKKWARKHNEGFLSPLSISGHFPLSELLLGQAILQEGATAGPNLQLTPFLSHKALQDGHTQFRASLDQAEDDIMMLRKLDRQIKSYNVSINP